ncbi:MAG: TlpA family protein disulfide reductase [Gammaproteobacteria bacterium]
MRCRITFILSAIAVLLLCTLSAQPLPAESPDLRLTRADGVEQSMAEYIGTGNWVIANIWSPSCSFCLQELPAVEAFYAKHKAEGVTVLGITLDYPSFEYGKIGIIRQFLQHHPLDYPIFLADLGMASEMIGKHLIGIPYTVIYRPDGRIHARWGGDIHVEEIEEIMATPSDDTDDWISGF